MTSGVGNNPRSCSSSPMIYKTTAAVQIKKALIVIFSKGSPILRANFSFFIARKRILSRRDSGISAKSFFCVALDRGFLICTRITPQIHLAILSATLMSLIFRISFQGGHTWEMLTFRLHRKMRGLEA